MIDNPINDYTIKLIKKYKKIWSQSDLSLLPDICKDRIS